MSNRRKITRGVSTPPHVERPRRYQRTAAEDSGSFDILPGLKAGDSYGARDADLPRFASVGSCFNATAFGHFTVSPTHASLVSHSLHRLYVRHALP